MKNISCFIVFLFIAKNLFSQRGVDTLPFRKNQVYVEGLGNGVPYSLNYERQIGVDKKGFTAIRIGFSKINDGTDYECLFPLLVTHISHRSGGNNFEFGGGFGLLIFPK